MAQCLIACVALEEDLSLVLSSYVGDLQSPVPPVPEGSVPCLASVGLVCMSQYIHKTVHYSKINSSKNFKREIQYKSIFLPILVYFFLSPFDVCII